MPELTLLVDDMGCRRCVREVTARLRDVPGVDRVVADASTRRVHLDGTMTEADVMDAMASTAFAVKVLEAESDPDNS